MPITIKTNVLKYKKQDGTYQGFNAITSQNKNKKTQQIRQTNMQASNLFLEAHSIYPANTLDAINTAISKGYKIIKMNVYYTKDNIAVIADNNSLDIQNDGIYEIAKYNYSVLKGKESNLLTLKEGLLQCKYKNLIVDIDYTKLNTYTDNQNASLVNIIDNIGFNHRCMITANIENLINIFDKNDSKLCVCITFSNMQQLDEIQYIISNSLFIMCFYEYSLHWISNEKELFQDFVNTSHKEGLFFKSEITDIDGSSDDIETIIEEYKKMYKKYGVDMIVLSMQHLNVLTNDSNDGNNNNIIK